MTKQLEQEDIQPTKYFEIMTKAYQDVYGQPSDRVFPTATKPSPP